MIFGKPASNSTNATMITRLSCVPWANQTTNGTSVEQTIEKDALGRRVLRTVIRRLEVTVGDASSPLVPLDNATDASNATNATVLVIVSNTTAPLRDASNATHNCTWVTEPAPVEDTLLMAPEEQAAKGVLGAVRGIVTDAEIILTFVKTLKDKFFGPKPAPPPTAAERCINATISCFTAAADGDDKIVLCSNNTAVVAACGGYSMGGVKCANATASCMLFGDGSATLTNRTLAYSMARCNETSTTCLAAEFTKARRQIAAVNASSVCLNASVACLDATKINVNITGTCGLASRACGGLACRSVATACLFNRAADDTSVESCRPDVITCILSNGTALEIANATAFDVLALANATEGDGARNSSILDVNVTALVSKKEGGVFNGVLSRVFGGPLQSAIAWVKGIWNTITDALGDFFSDAWDAIKDAIAALGDVWDTLTDFSALEDAFLGVGFIADAKKSLEAVFSTLSNIGRTIAGAVKGGVDGVMKFVASARRTYDQVTAMLQGSAVSALPLPATTQKAISTIFKFAPTALKLGQMVLRMLNILPPSGDNSTMQFPWLATMMANVTKQVCTSLPTNRTWPNGTTTSFINVTCVTQGPTSMREVAGQVIANILGELRKLPPVALVQSVIEGAGDFVKLLNASLPKLKALFDAGVGVAQRAGTRLASLADGGSLPFQFTLTGGVDSMMTSVTGRLLPVFTVAQDLFNDAVVLLETWADESGSALPALDLTDARRLHARRMSARRLVETESTIERLVALRTVVASGIATANSLFSDIRSVIAAVGDWDGVSDALGVVSKLANMTSDTMTYIVAKVRGLMGFMDGIGLLPGSWSTWITGALDAIIGLQPKITSLASFGNDTFNEVRESVLGGVLSVVTMVESTLLTASSTLEDTIDTLTTVADTAITLTPAEVAADVASTIQRLADTNDLLQGVFSQLSDAPALRSSMSGIAKISQVMVVAANVVQTVRTALGSLPDTVMGKIREMIQQVKDALPPGFTNALTVVSNIISLKDVISAASKVYWALKGGNSSAIFSALPSISSVVSKLRGMIGNLTIVDTLYRVAASTASTDPDGIGVTDVSRLLQLGTAAGRTTVVDTIEVFMPYVTRTMTTLAKAYLDVRRRARGDPPGSLGTLTSDINELLVKTSQKWVDVQTNLQQPIAVVSTFTGQGFGFLRSVLADVSSVLNFADAKVLGFVTDFADALLPIDALGPTLLGLIQGLKDIAATGISAIGAAKDLVGKVESTVALTQSGVGDLLAKFPEFMTAFNSLSTLLQQSQSFYLNERNNPDAAEKLLASFDLAFNESIAILLPFNGSSTALTTGLNAVGDFLSAADAVVRLRTVFKLDNSDAVSTLTNAASLFSRILAGAAKLLEQFGLPGSEVLTQISTTVGNIDAIKTVFTKVMDLVKMGQSGITTFIEQAKSAFNAITAIGKRVKGMAGTVTKLMTARRSGSPAQRAAAMLDPATIDAIVTAAANGAVSLGAAVQASQLVAGDLLRRVTAGPVNASDDDAVTADLVSIGGMALSANDGAAALESTADSLAVLLPGVCSVVGAVGDVAGLVDVVGQVQSRLNIFDKPLQTFVELITGAMDLIASMPQLAVISGGLEDARSLFASLQATMASAVTAVNAAIPDLSIVKDMNSTLASLCDTRNGSLVVLRKGATIMRKIQAVYKAADASGSGLVLKAADAALAGDLTATLVPLRLLNDVLADGSTVTTTLVGLKDVSNAVVTISSVVTGTFTPGSTSSGFGQLDRLTSSITSILSAMGAPSGATQVFLEGANAIKKVSALADLIKALYEKVKNSSLGKKLWCIIQKWLKPSNATNTTASTARALAASGATVVLPRWTWNGHAAPASMEEDTLPWPIYLTRKQTMSAGAAYAPVAVSPRGFNATFSFKIGRGSHNTGEGLVFLLHRDPRGPAAVGAWNQAGKTQDYSCMGYCGITPSFGIRFDHQTGTMPQSTAGILTQGRIGTPGGEWLVLAGTDKQYREGLTTVRVSYMRGWAGADRRLNVTITQAGGSRANTTASYVVSDSALPDLYTSLGCSEGTECRGFVGFTAATGTVTDSRISVRGFATTLYETIPSPSATATSSLTGSATRSPAGTSIRPSRSVTGTPTLSGSATQTRGRSPSGTGTRTLTATPTLSKGADFFDVFDPSASPTATGSAIVIPAPPGALEMCGVSSPVNVSSLFATVKDTFMSLVNNLKTTFNATRSANGTLAAVTTTINVALDYAEGALDKVSELADAVQNFDLLKNISLILSGSPDDLVSGDVANDINAVVSLLDSIKNSISNVSASAASTNMLGPLTEPLQDVAGFLDSIDIGECHEARFTHEDYTRILCGPLPSHMNHACSPFLHTSTLLHPPTHTRQPPAFPLPAVGSLSGMVASVKNFIGGLQPDLSPVVNILRLIAKQRSVVRVIRKLLPMVDVVASGVERLKSVATFFKSLASNSTSNAGTLSMLQKFKQLLPTVTTMFADLKTSFASVGETFASNVTWVTKANAVITTLNNTINFVGAAFAEVGPATQKVQRTLVDLLEFAQQGLKRLADKVTDMIAKAVNFRNDVDVIDAGLAPVIGSVVDTILNFGPVSKLLNAMGELANTPISPEMLGPINGVLTSVGKLSGLSNVMTKLSGMMGDAMLIVEQVDLLGTALKVAGSNAITGMSSIKDTLVAFWGGLKGMNVTFAKVKAYLNATKDSGMTKVRSVINIVLDGINGLPSLDNAFTQVKNLITLVNNLISFGKGPFGKIKDAVMNVIKTVTAITSGAVSEQMRSNDAIK